MQAQQTPGMKFSRPLLTLDVYGCVCWLNTDTISQHLIPMGFPLRTFESCHNTQTLGQYSTASSGSYLIPASLFSAQFHLRIYNVPTQMFSLTRHSQATNSQILGQDWSSLAGIC